MTDSQISPEGLAMTLHALLLRMARLDPVCRTVALCGLEGMDTAVTASGWALAEVEHADLVVLWNCPSPEEARPRLFLVLGPPQAVPDGYTEILQKRLGIYDSLNAWFARLAKFLPASMAAPTVTILRHTGATKVVGARMCKLRHLSWVQQILLRKGEPEPEALQESAGDRFRDAAMSVFGIGHTPLFAANTASLVVTLAAAAVWAAAGWGVMQGVLIAALILSTAGCVLFEKWAAIHYLTDDAREVVLDEVAGMSLTLLFLPASAGGFAFVAAFFAFRFFDIFKPGIHWVEETGLRGTIVWDDILAGLYAGGLLFLGWHIF